MEMACVENIPPRNADSEMEEGEIVDDLSDISSEEEFLLRQRLQVLENYNNVLERKKAKHTSGETGSKHKKEEALLHDLSEISATELDDCCSKPQYKNFKVQRNVKVHHKQKRRKEEPHENIVKTRDIKKKTHRPKRKLEVKVISESSEESEDEYRNSRRKLAEAVVVNKHVAKNDKTSLSERLQKMLCGVNPEPTKLMIPDNKLKTPIKLHVEEQVLSTVPTETVQVHQSICELIDLCTDNDDNSNNSIVKPQVTVDTVPQVTVDTVDSVIKTTKGVENINNAFNKGIISDKDSDEDLELLRQHALKTKTAKATVAQVKILEQTENKILSEDEDSDTTELRLICLKSALLKKAIEMKQKQKLQKRLSQSSNVQDDFMLDTEIFGNKMQSENNTDTESVDMDIGSDAEEKSKENLDDCAKFTAIETTKIVGNNIPDKVQCEDELEEDEDLLRAKLLTSLSKNLPNLVNPDIMKSIGSVKKDTESLASKPKQPPINSVIPVEKRFIINLGDSDSEGEHEATKNLTKMHMKLSEQLDFQQRLDIFLKTTRMEVEKASLLNDGQAERQTDVITEPPKKSEKFVAKAVKHLPKPEQIEYKNLVKRMAELEKIKQARQFSMDLNTIKVQVPVKDTLKPRNVTIESTRLNSINNLEEQIKMSRKNIAEESAKILKLKEEETKLSQKYKIVATEFRNIKTAIALNKKQQRSVHTCLAKIRLHHQMLLKSSINSTHSKINNQIPPLSQITRLQKENNPSEKDSKNIALPKVAKLVPREVKEPPVLLHPRLSVQIEVTDNKKNVKITSSGPINNNLNLQNDRKSNQIVNKRLLRPIEEKGGGIELHKCEENNLQNGAENELQKGELETLQNGDDELKEGAPKDLTKDRGNELQKWDGKEVHSDHKGIQDVNDYKSPLDAFGNTTWEGDPNAILCPFEVGGDCKDADCKYLHTEAQSK